VKGKQRTLHRNECVFYLREKVRVFEKGEFLGTVSKIDCSKQSQINPIQL
jgi:phosphoribosyl-AMP cyclohydrolase